MGQGSNHVQIGVLVKGIRNRDFEVSNLYPLGFEEAISDVLKVKPEPRKQKSKARKKATRGSNDLGQQRRGNEDYVRVIWARMG